MDYQVTYKKGETEISLRCSQYGAPYVSRVTNPDAQAFGERSAQEFGQALTDAAKEVFAATLNVLQENERAANFAVDTVENLLFSLDYKRVAIEGVEGDM